MATWLKQSTSATIVLGPFVDDTDGKTAEASLNLVVADVRLSKNGGTWGAKSEATNPGNAMENGWYAIALNATDTGTLGSLVVNVSKTGALPVWREFNVVPANSYDSIVAGSASLTVDGTATVIEGTLTMKSVLRLLLAAAAGKSTGFGTASVKYRSNADDKDRIAATVDTSGNRSAVTLDGT